MTAAAPDADLSDRLAVVTGVCGRLGPVWTDALLAAGAAVVGLDRAGAPDARLREVLEVHGDKAFRFHTADVTDRAGLERVLGACSRPPDVLVNNAGVDSPPSAAARGWEFRDVPVELSGTVLDVNALGTLLACQVFGSAMAARGGGSIVNIGSLYAGLAPDQRLYAHLPLDPPFLKPPAYGMSKAAVGALTRYLAALWGGAGVRVNTLSPGGVLGDQDAEFVAKFSDRVPLRRMAVAADLRGPLLFLASPQSGYVTGTELLVDGGYGCW
ncbi:SDR family oxidoreductase [Actinophytocola xanthii]|uniref:Dehydrogenase n=1 Tax=Actinophytocola xanthii TaxID=1912961 RepID=A0A1Q8CSA7_9PSEU|nr:SDR family oxidoreductase [Actinophytocola xanthii]OLF17234.1 dehydrogenase [Actinophytocola xanthii]